ncbi:Pycsar system effector family protein [Candidatus Frankia nodulisporulans]|uniref:Pycsar system effector family protein n=1 Tax=Candidatus Frankia nodulisporulans TaxID=2060052 RepID=UPI0013D85DEC|nr:Pycsar system effector family protein [Candidatus Frankia nodulisporulans]
MTAPAADGLALLAELDRQHAAVREELGRANATALGVAGAAATLAAVGLAALMAGDWTPASLPTAAQAVWWTAVLAAAGGLALLGSAVLPRLAPREAGPPTSWGPIAAYDQDDDLAQALTAQTLDPTARVAHLRALARIARIKWARIRQALLAFAGAGVLLTALALGTAVLR